MKTLFTLIIALLSVNLVCAQSETATIGKPSFGIYGGINFQNINGKDADGSDLSNSLVTRFHLGINEEIPIAPDFYAQLGLQFMSKGTKGSVLYNDNMGSHSITREIKMNYVELLMNFAYKPLVGKGNFILGFGPYVGYSISGKALFTGNASPSDAEIEYGKNAPNGTDNNHIYFKRLDVGSNFFFGYQLASGLNLVFNSQLGLVNINSNSESDLAEKNTGFGLSLGYRF